MKDAKLNTIQVISVFTPASHRGGLGSIPGPCEICGEKSRTGTGFSLSGSFHQCSILIFIHTLLLPGQTGEAWGPSRNQCCFGYL